MAQTLMVQSLVVWFCAGVVIAQRDWFLFNGFESANLSLNGASLVRGNGALQLTNSSLKLISHAFYRRPLSFSNDTSFITTFVFAIVPQMQGQDWDIDGNHLGIDINSLVSNASESAAYYSRDNQKHAIILDNAVLIQAWVGYRAREKHIDVTIAPFRVDKPHCPLISHTLDLLSVLLPSMYVGFSSATRKHLSRLPSFPRPGAGSKHAETIHIGVLIQGSIPGHQRLQGPRGFRFRWLQGSKGVLPGGPEVAVKRVFHGSKRVVREFIAEVVSLGRLHHRNLVQLQGWCKRKDNLLLVCDYMPNESLDRLIFHGDDDEEHEKQQHRAVLGWKERYRVLQDVAAAQLYHHEEWEQVVVHRDVKASNVLLDFGARAHTHLQDNHRGRRVCIRCIDARCGRRS
ncbi:hypothetical protein AMTRI_Chr06g192780 [Amborella trichopoda]